MQPGVCATDPLLWDFDLPLRAVYYPAGFPVEIVTNSAEVLAAAEESWGMFEKAFPLPNIQIRLGVLTGSSKECPPTPTYRGQRNLITLVADAENFVVLDTRQGFAFGWLAEATVRNRAYLRYHFLEGTAWILLTCLYLTPVHGACVSRDGRGVLLLGDGGAGKTSLAYACARNGWTFLSDDSSSLVRERGGRTVTGNPHRMRFCDSAMDLFPELGNQRVSARLSGELSIELETARMPEIAVSSECVIDYLVFLNRHDPAPEGLFHFPKGKALRWLEQVMCYGEEYVRAEHRTALRDLVTAEVFELRYTTLDSALRLLEGLVRSGSSVAQPCIVIGGDSKNG